MSLHTVAAAGNIYNITLYPNVDVCDADVKTWAMEFLGANSALIEAARREFDSFYATASPEDVGWMNALVSRMLYY